MEHTGIYAHLLETLYALKLSIWVASSLPIKRAGGMQRGKTARRPGDKVDAQRIAQYARAVPLDNGSIKRPGPPRYNLLAVPLAEQETFVARSLQKALKGRDKKSLMALKEDRTDFYDSNNNGGIKIFIFFSAVYASKNTMDQLITDVIDNRSGL